MYSCLEDEKLCSSFAFDLQREREREIYCFYSCNSFVREVIDLTYRLLLKAQLSIVKVFK